MYDLILLGAALLIIALCAGIAAIFGFRKATVQLSITAICAVLSVCACWLMRLFIPTPEVAMDLLQNNLDRIGGQFGPSVVSIIEQSMEFASISPTLLELFTQLAVALPLPLFCLTLFVSLCVASWSIYLVVLAIIRFVKKIIRKKKDQNHETASGTDEQQEPEKSKGRAVKLRLAAAGMGAVQGLIITAVIMLPISGYLALATPVLNALYDTDILPEDNATVSQVHQIVNQANDCAVLKIYRALGGRTLADSFMRVTVADTNVKLSEEIGSVITLSRHIIELTETEFKDYSEEEAEIIRAIGASFANSKLLSPIVGDILYAATEAWLNGETFIGMEKPTLGEEAEILEPMLTTLLEIFNQDARETLLLQADVQTTADLVAVLAQNGVFANLSNTDDLLDSLSGNIISELITTLGGNDSMKRLVPEIMNLGVRAIGQILSIPADTEQVFDNFMNDVANTLNEIKALPEQERVQKLSEELEGAFDDAGVDIDAQVLDYYSTAMLHDLVDSNDGQVSAQDVQAFFILYAEQTLQPSSSSARPGFDLLSSTDAQNSDPFAGTVYESMTEAQRQNSAAAAVATLCVKLSTLDENDTDITETASRLAADAFADVLADNPAALEIVQNVQITAPVSSTTTEQAASLQSTEELKKTSAVVTLDTLLVNAKQAADSIDPETIGLDAEAISTIFETASNLLDVLGDSGKDFDLAELADSVGAILDSLAETQIFGKDKTASLFTSVLQSETVRDKANLDIKTATEIAKKATEGEVDYTRTMNTVATGVHIMEKLSDDDTVSEEELVELIRNLNAQTAGMIEVYVTPARMTKHGIPEKHSKISSDLIKSIFSFMGNENLENYDVEEKALNQVLSIALAAKKDDDTKLFSSAPGADDGKLPTATETVNILLDSKAVRHALKDVLTDGGQVTVNDPYELSCKIKPDSKDYTDLVAAIEAYGAAHSDVDRLTIEALAALFGVALN